MVELRHVGEKILGKGNRIDMEHCIGKNLLSQRVRVHLVGVGGNGAQMANCLARLDIAIRALGHPHGLHVTAFDGDTVSESNVGRQVYSSADVGLHKAVVTINRLNQYFGLDWDAVPSHYKAQPVRDYSGGPAIIISCVDSARARRELHGTLFNRDSGVSYWLDLGNTENSAQVVLGQPKAYPLPERDEWGRLPCVTELFPQLLEDREEDVAPSCSVRISLQSQGLFVNDMAVRWASQLLYELFQGPIKQHGVLVNLSSKRAGPIDVNPSVWRRFGLKRRKPRGLVV